MQLFDTGGHQPVGHGLAFSPDGRFLVAVTRSARLCLLDTQTGEARQVPMHQGNFPLEGAAFTADGRAVAVAVTTAAPPVRLLRAYDVSTGQLLPDYFASDVTTVAAAPGGKTIFGAQVSLVRDRSRSEIIRYGGDGKRRPPFGRHSGRDDVLAVSGDGTRFAASCGKYTRVWNVAGDTPPARATCQIKTQGWVKSLALSKDGGILAGAVRNRVIVWDAKTGDEKFRHSKHKLAVNGVAISPARPLLVSGGNDGLVFVYDAAAGEELKRLEWKIGEVVALAFAPDGLRCAAAGAGGKVVVWDVDA